MRDSRPAWRKRPSFASARRQRRLIRQFAGNRSDVVFDHDWRAIPYTRAAIVNLLLADRPGGRYLEIGCAGDELFNAVMAADKVGVDPVRGGTHRMTSDAYFAANPDQRFDVIFIDGLHLYDQVRRDLVNGLAALNPGGWIALHDSFPRDWLEEHVPQIITSGWTGDGWKVAFELLESDGIEFRLVAIDHGVIVVKPIVPGARLADKRAELAPARFDYFAERFAWLPVTDYPGAQRWIEVLRAPEA